MRPMELQRDPAAVTRILRQSIDPERLRRVLRLAGADEVVGSAGETLREAAADALARRLVRPGSPQPFRRSLDPQTDANTLEEARASTKRAYIELAVHMAGASIGPEAVQQALVIEIATLAHHAVRFARVEGRAVDQHCIAVAAGRNSDEALDPFVASI
ncbi:MAG: hypothetical protein ABR562_03985 [Thermoplasmatota archaeon]